jgi:hypothetical protein
MREPNPPMNPSKDIWRCRSCGAINAWNWEDAERYEKRFKLEPGTVKHSTGSCFDNICGGCGTDFVRRDSPIRAVCYTHEGE